MSRERKIILGIDTGIGGGSLSISDGQKEIGEWAGDEELSKVEDILEHLSELFSQNNFDRRQIELINVSDGPGSSTGIKIGLAVAKGLSDAVGCRLMQISVLKAIGRFFSLEHRKKVLVVLPAGRSKICWQIFEGGQSLYEAKITSVDLFLDKAVNLNYAKDCEVLITHKKLAASNFAGNFADLSGKNKDALSVIDFGDNPAKFLTPPNFDSRASDNDE